MDLAALQDLGERVADQLADAELTLGGGLALRVRPVPFTVAGRRLHGAAEHGARRYSDRAISSTR